MLVCHGLPWVPFFSPRVGFLLYFEKSDPLSFFRLFSGRNFLSLSLVRMLTALSGQPHGLPGLRPSLPSLSENPGSTDIRQELADGFQLCATSTKNHASPPAGRERGPSLGSAKGYFLSERADGYDKDCKKASICRDAWLCGSLSISSQRMSVSLRNQVIWRLENCRIARDSACLRASREGILPCRY